MADSTTVLYLKIGVTKYGSFIDETKASDTNIDQLALNDFDYIKFKIGIKEDAKNQGGLNLFGERFGDYPQNIVMTVYYTVILSFTFASNDDSLDWKDPTPQQIASRVLSRVKPGSIVLFRNGAKNTPAASK